MIVPADKQLREKGRQKIK